jgi:hypothetical protein
MRAGELLTRTRPRRRPQKRHPGDFVEKGYLPKERPEGCKDEYQQVAYAFQQLIGPHLDPVLAKEVMDKTWLPDAKWNVQRQDWVGTPEMIHSGFASAILPHLAAFTEQLSTLT